MTFKELLNKKLGIEDVRDAPGKLLKVLFNDKEREELFEELLEHQKNDLDYDWFFEYFQEEHSERKKLKQDFTPQEVARVIGGVTKQNKVGQNVYDAAAGTGTLFIEKWVQNGRNTKDWYRLDEISDRTVPFLLFNMAVRGVNGILVHGDSLNKTAKGILAVRNCGKFSRVDVMPYSEDVEKEYNIEFTEKIYSDKVAFSTKVINLYNSLKKKEEMKNVTYKYKTIAEVIKDYETITVSNGKKLIDIINQGKSSSNLDRDIEIKEVMDMGKAVNGEGSIARIIIEVENEKYK